MLCLKLTHNLHLSVFTAFRALALSNKNWPLFAIVLILGLSTFAADTVRGHGWVLVHAHVVHTSVKYYASQISAIIIVDDGPLGLICVDTEPIKHQLVRL